MWKAEMMKIINKLEIRKDSECFREPVPFMSLGLLDYPLIIEKPTDLLTIKTNLASDSYATLEDVAIDVRLIFLNALTYNAPGSRVYNQAKTLGDFWESQWSDFPNKTEIDLDKPPTVEEMTDWVEKCRRLEHEVLGEILCELDRCCSNCFVKKLDSDEVDVNVDLITGSAFSHICAFTEKNSPQLQMAGANRRSISSLSVKK